MLYRITTLEKSETRDSLPHNLTETGLHRSHFPRDGFRDGVQEARTPPPSPYFFWNRAQVKHTKTTNTNKIYQIELRLKEMACLMIIAETKKTFSAFQFFH